MLFATYTIALFCFLCWLQYDPEINPNSPPLKTGAYQGQETTSKNIGDAMEPQTNKPLEVDTAYWSRADELLNIRQLKKKASEAHIRGYGKLTKAQLIEALTA